MWHRDGRSFASQDAPHARPSAVTSLLEAVSQANDRPAWLIEHMHASRNRLAVRVDRPLHRHCITDASAVFVHSSATRPVRR
jgi:hypothetical protein